VPEFERRWARFASPINPSWRVDETSMPVRGRWNYLYRAVDRNGKWDCRNFCVKSHTLPEEARKMYGEERHKSAFR
jgi:transposase-like protein